MGFCSKTKKYCGAELGPQTKPKVLSSGAYSQTQEYGHVWVSLFCLCRSCLFKFISFSQFFADGSHEKVRNHFGSSCSSFGEATSVCRCIQTFIWTMAPKAAKAAPKRALRQVNTDAHVKEKVKNNFPGWDERRLRGVFRGNPPVCLIDSLTEDTRRLKQSELAMGSRYYKAKRSEYADDETPVQQIAKNSEASGGGGLDPSLRHAIKMAKGVNQDRSFVIDWLQTTPQVGPTEVKGLCQWFAELNPGVRSQLRDMVLAFAECAHRLRSADIEVNRLNILAIKNILDVCLQGAFGSAKWTLWDFLRGHRGALSVLCGAQRINRLFEFEDTEEWHMAEDSICWISQHTVIGSQILVLPQSQVLSRKIKEAIAEQKATMLTVLSWTKEFLQRTRATAKSLCEGLPGAALLTEPRKITFVWHGAHIPIVAKAVADEAFINVEAAMRQVAGSSNNGLVGWANMQDFFPSAESPITVPKEVSVKAKVVRETFNDLLAHSTVTAKDGMLELLNRRSKQLKGNDEGWVIDEAVMTHLCSGDASAKVKQRMNGILPRLHASAPPSAQTALTEIDALLNSGMLRFCESTIESDIRRLRAALQAIIGNNVVAVGSSKGQWLLDMMGRLVECARFTFMEGHSSKTVYGQAALDSRLDYCQKRLGSGADITFSDVNDLNVYAFAFNNLDQKTIRDMSLKVSVPVSSPTKAAKLSSTSSASSSSGASFSKAAVITIDDEIDKLFG